MKLDTYYLVISEYPLIPCCVLNVMQPSTTRWSIVVGIRLAVVWILQGGCRTICKFAKPVVKLLLLKVAVQEIYSTEKLRLFSTLHVNVSPHTKENFK